MDGATGPYEPVPKESARMNDKQNKLLALAGATAIAAFFLPFLDLGGMFQASGWDIVTAERTGMLTRIAFILLPVGGVAMLLGGLGGGRKARFAGVAFGLGVFGYLGFQLVRAFVATSGVGLWLTIAAAFVGLTAALASRK